MRRTFVFLVALAAMTFCYAGSALGQNVPPDLVVDYTSGPNDGRVEPGAYVSYYVEIANRGGSSAIFSDGSLVATQTSAGLEDRSCYVSSGYTCDVNEDGVVEVRAQGEQRLGVGQYLYMQLYGSAPADSGKLTYSAVLDPENKVAEVREDNNASSIITTYVGDPPPTNLAVAQQNPTDKVFRGYFLDYEFTVSNIGDDTSFGTIARFSLPENVKFDYASADNARRSCYLVAEYRTVICPLGNILSGESDTVRIYVVARELGSAIGEMEVSNEFGDTDSSDNKLTTATEIQKRDFMSPTVKKLVPGPNKKIKNRTPVISAVVRDNITDLKKSNIQFFLDDKKRNFSYNTKTDKLTFRSPKLSYKPHKVRIVATDTLGNKVNANWIFRVVK